MKPDFEFLYVGTAIMLFLSLMLIFLVIWATVTIKNQQAFFNKKQEFWLERIDSVEALVRTEFKAILEHIKKNIIN